MDHYDRDEPRMIKPGVPVQQPSASGIARVTDFSSGMIIAVYLLVVIYQGNMGTLAQDATQDYGYLEWLVAIAILYEVYRLVPSKIVAWLIIAGVVAAVLRMTSRNQSVVTAINAYAKGNTDLFGAIASLGSKSTTTRATVKITPNVTPTTPTQPTQQPIIIPQTQTNSAPSPNTIAMTAPSTNGAGILQTILG